MTCPECGGKTKVMDTVTISEEVYRRRKCLSCDKLFYTVEKNVGYQFDVRFKFNQAKMGYLNRKDERE